MPFGAFLLMLCVDASPVTASTCRKNSPAARPRSARAWITRRPACCSVRFCAAASCTSRFSTGSWNSSHHRASASGVVSPRPFASLHTSGTSAEGIS